MSLNFDVDEIRRLYEGEGLSIREVGRILGVSHQTVANRLKSIGIERRGRAPAPVKVDGEMLFKLCEDQQLSLQSIAAKLHIRVGSLRRAMKECGIRRPRTSRYIPLDRERLYQLYIVEGFTQVKTAALLKVTIDKLRKELRRHGIEDRHKRGKDPIVVDHDRLYREYVVERKSQQQVAASFGLTAWMIRRELRRHNIEHRHVIRKPFIRFDRRVIYRLYVRERLSYVDTANRLGVSVCNVRSELKRHSIPPRPRGGKSKK